MIWLAAKAFGMRAASGVVGVWFNPVGKILMVAGVVLAVYLGWEQVKIEQGRAQERAKFAARSAEAERLALRARLSIEEERDRRAAVDAEGLAGIAIKETAVRDANSGDAVLWRASDGWLRSKRDAGTGGRSRRTKVPASPAR